MSPKTIWVNEQIDPGGLIHACIACRNEAAANDCHQTGLIVLLMSRNKMVGLLVCAL